MNDDDIKCPLCGNLLRFNANFEKAHMSINISNDQSSVSFSAFICTFCAYDIQNKIKKEPKTKT